MSEPRFLTEARLAPPSTHVSRAGDLGCRLAQSPDSQRRHAIRRHAILPALLGGLLVSLGLASLATLFWSGASALIAGLPCETVACAALIAGALLLLLAGSLALLAAELAGPARYPRKPR